MHWLTNYSGHYIHYCFQNLQITVAVIVLTLLEFQMPSAAQTGLQLHGYAYHGLKAIRTGTLAPVRY